MSISVRNEGAKVNSNINVTPMVDVMLVLLIIFMVITPMLQNKVNVDLAKTDNPTANETGRAQHRTASHLGCAECGVRESLLAVRRPVQVHLDWGHSP
jgi:hypothetical protein